MTLFPFLSPALMALAAVLLDRLLGEPRRWHPLVGFGWLAQRMEAFLYGPATTRPFFLRLRGVAAVLLPLAGAAFLVHAAQRGLDAWAWTLTIPLLYLAIGATSLEEHAAEVQRALNAGDLEQARQKVGRMVSRDTGEMGEAAVARAAVESVLENGCDAVLGALFWFLVAGAPGAVLYRLANTLDAMWGYKTDRYRDFGWAAARLDDALNWVPARLTALTYTLLGRSRSAWRCWRTQAPGWESPNAGPVMAAGAGALLLRLGGPAIYQGRPEMRPVLGEGREVVPADIARAASLMRRGIWLWLAVAPIVGWALA